MNLNKQLKEVFGYKNFKANQEEIIKAIIGGRDVFAAMPTGGGKSLCYQLPAVILEGLTIVVSPLVALMKDQVDEAVENGIPAAYINSSLSAEEAQREYSRLFRGETKLLYLSPERLSLEGYFEKLKDLSPVLFAVDEAHCMSEWGHDFRPDYLVLSKIRKHFPETPIAAFTATATVTVQADIIKLLRLKKPLIVRASFNRPELFYRVEQKDDVLAQIAAFIGDHEGQAGIVYRTSRKDVEKTADYLKSRGIKAKPYHAGLPQEKRKQNQEQFNRDKIDVICATIAFGMGINKQNVRFVVHGDLPRSIEGYYQETGRAGRDGMDSECLLLYSSGDLMKIRYHIDKMENEAEKKKAAANLNLMSAFASVNVCRRKQLLEYFDEPAENNCGSCDICSGNIEKADATVDARKFLSAAVRTGERFGIVHIIDVVYGADTEKIRKFRHNEIKTWGTGSGKPKKWWRAIADDLIRQEAVIQDAESYNALKLTPAGRDILFGRKPFYIIKKKDQLPSGRGEQGFLRPADSSATSAKYDKKMFACLKDLRFEIAAARKIPPYIIFSDKTLKDMCIIKPVDNSSFLRVSGVGERKLAEYGPMFISKIREYLGY